MTAHLTALLIVIVLAGLLVDVFVAGARLVERTGYGPLVLARGWSVLAELWPFVTAAALMALILYACLARIAIAWGESLAKDRHTDRSLAERRNARGERRLRRLRSRLEAATARTAAASRLLTRRESLTAAEARSTRILVNRHATEAIASHRRRASATLDLKTRLEHCAQLERAIAALGPEVARLEAAVPKRPPRSRRPRHAAGGEKASET